LNHGSLEVTPAGDSTLRVRDREDPIGATVDLEIDSNGRPLTCRAERPRTAGKKAILTPWRGVCREVLEYDGLRVASHVEAAWEFPEGKFTYFWAEVTSLAIIKASAASL